MPMTSPVYARAVLLYSRIRACSLSLIMGNPGALCCLVLEGAPGFPNPLCLNLTDVIPR